MVEEARIRSRPRGTHLTLATSLVLNLKPGTWYYRVRGYDYNLPTGAQEMAWSKPTKIVVAAPKFHVIALAVRRQDRGFVHRVAGEALELVREDVAR